ncbi:BMC domain-containing protein [Desulfosporosinus sp.]|uniref:BMC domain-containing protein n=1 Tax=Desulfosporosinus sp. TaxID=157907 RepID=UPI0025BD71F3|nr:BMC domain-containing protein [Desulfosporosinus sp.]MBC2722095.1 BMC domain-containing protein [Desulfosporosinus sp.]MBC2726427.1 BMC domain-containing protein [Desulfosporosinus sp.]
MKALGLIETYGLLPAIECADVMLKTAQVELLGKTLVGGGLVTITVTGDVGAVKAAVEAGAIAVETIGHQALISRHVIPRPDPEIESVILVREEKLSVLPNTDLATNVNVPLANNDAPTERQEKVKILKESTKPEQMTLKQLRKEGVDALVQEFGLEQSLNVLKTLSVVKLRNLVRDYKELDIAGRAVSKANKELLIRKLKEFYERASEM